MKFPGHFDKEVHKINEKLRICFVVVTLNSSRTIRESLNTITRLYPWAFQIIIDNNSSDHTLLEIKNSEYCENRDLIALPVNAGFTRVPTVFGVTTSYSFTYFVCQTQTCIGRMKIPFTR